MPIPIFSAMVVAALLCSAATILGPAAIIGTCPAAGMVVRAENIVLWQTGRVLLCCSSMLLDG